MIAIIIISVFMLTFIYYGFIVELENERKQRKEERRKYIFYSKRKFNK